MPLKCSTHIAPADVPCIRPPVPPFPESPRLPVMSVNGLRPDADGNVSVYVLGMADVAAEVAKETERAKAEEAKNASAAKTAAAKADEAQTSLDDHVGNRENPHNVTAAQVGALPLSGGALTGDLAVGGDHTASRKLTVSSDDGADGITLQGGRAFGSGSSVTVGASTDGEGGSVSIEGGGNYGGRLYVRGRAGAGGGAVEVSGLGASITKNGLEVATETYVDDAVSGVEGTLRTLVGVVDSKADKTELASKADIVGGKVPAAQLPSFVDDVLEYDALSAFPATGETGKIYVSKDTNKTYRWGGTQYVEISQSLALGETSATAYPGDKGKDVADSLKNHVENTLNPHAVTAAQVGAVALVEDRFEERSAVTIGFRLGDVGPKSIVNGMDAIASGIYSHAEGADTRAEGAYCHTEGNGTAASGKYSHAEGGYTIADGYASHAEGYKANTIPGDKYAFAWNGDDARTDPYVSHGPGTFNVNPTGGSEGFYVGEKKLSEVILGSVTNNISAENPTFSNAVLAVGLNIDTNSVAVLNDIAATFGGFPIEGTATTVGGLLAALAAAVAWLKKNKADQTALDELAAKVDSANAKLEEVA